MNEKGLYSEAIDEFNKKDRIFYDGSDSLERIKIYNQNAQILAKYNNFIIQAHKGLRILSWNVRYFTDTSNNPTITEQCKIISEEIKPDLICLQEVTLGNNRYYNTNEFKTQFNKHMHH